MMGNIRWFLTVTAVFFFVYIFFSFKKASTIQTTQQDLNVSKKNKVQPPAENEILKRNLAQTDDSQNSNPRRIQIRFVNQINPPSPKPQELKEITLAEVSENWKLWPIKKAIFPSEVQKLSPHFKVGTFEIIDSASQIHNLNDFSSQEPWVLFNERLNTIGILTGTITIKLNQPETWDSLEKEMNLKLIHSFPELGLFIATSQSSRFDLEATLKSLKENSQVQKAELEIVSRNYVQ